MAGSNPTVNVSGSREGVTILGAISHEGESFYTWSEETLTADHGIAFIRALEAEFGEQIIVLLDQAPYFYAKELWDYVGGEQSTDFVGNSSVECVVGDTVQIWYFPSHAPELNPVEHCWDQLESWFNYRLIRDLDELKTLLKQSFETISPPKISNYLCP